MNRVITTHNVYKADGALQKRPALNPSLAVLTQGSTAEDTFQRMTFGEETKNQKIKKRKKKFLEEASDKTKEQLAYRKSKQKQTRADNTSWLNTAKKFIAGGGDPDDLDID